MDDNASNARENIVKPTSFPFRDLLAMEVEETLPEGLFDGWVGGW